jgi:uncharacterized protein with GYD domain
LAGSGRGAGSGIDVNGESGGRLPRVTVRRYDAGERGDVAAPTQSHWEDQVPYFMLSLTYSHHAVKALVAKPTDRTKAAADALEAAGGKLHSLFMAFGDADAIAIYETPDATSAAAVAMTLGASGGMASVKTTPLLTMAEAVKAMEKAGKVQASYKPPSA